ncbi:MAG: phage major capsid protein [Candidatus Galacturonibacter soehngenii]|nr:phage major capsid protein [Candidatus Galacturonibacter soehngenii]
MNLKELIEKRNTLLGKIESASTGEELDTIELELRKLNMQIADLEARAAGGSENDLENNPAARSEEGAGQGGEPEQRRFNPIASYRNGTPTNNQVDNDDLFGSLEYRKAFRNYIVSGTPIPESFRQTEQRADSLTVVGDVGAVIPTTIMSRVIEDLTVEGKLISRITQTSVQGGIAYPISEIMPEAHWLESEEAVSDEQKAKMEAKLTFQYHVLEAKVGVGLLSATVSLPVFESTLVTQLKKAMIRAIETSIISGNGSGQPLGITKYALPVDQKITFTSATIGTVKQWAKVEAAIPEAYEDGVVYLMNKATWEEYLNGMTDSNGQKIGLGKINERGQKILNGREVITTDKLPSFNNAKAGDIFGCVVNLEEYLLNSNLSMYYKKYFNEDKNKWIHKALMIVDGKMAIGTVGEGENAKLVGANGLIYLTK